MRMIFATIAAAVLLVPSAKAQDLSGISKADLKQIRECLAKGDEKACIGTIANPCQDLPGGSSTMGIDECLGREQKAWDVILNERYKEATAAAKELDSRLPELGMEPVAAKSLVKAQRAWIAFRDAECDRIFDLNIEGTIRTVAAANCMTDMTAQRAIDLGSDE